MHRVRLDTWTWSFFLRNFGLKKTLWGKVKLGEVNSWHLQPTWAVGSLLRCRDSQVPADFLHFVEEKVCTDDHWRDILSFHNFLRVFSYFWNEEILQLVVGGDKGDRKCTVVMLGHREGLRVWDVSFVFSSALVIVSNYCSITHPDCETTGVLVYPLPLLCCTLFYSFFRK